MSVGKVSFRGVETPAPQPQIQEQTKISSQSPEVDEEKSNAAKYMIGATALAGVVALGIAGYKGHLGEGVQKFLGGAKKVAEKEASKAAETAAETASSSAPKIKKYTAEELSKIAEKDIKEVSDAELKRILATIVPDEEPALRVGLEKYVDVIKSDPNTKGKISELTHEVPVIKRWARMKLGQDGVEKMFGQNSPALKKINELKLGDIIDLLPKNGIAQFSEEQVAALNMFDKNMKITELLESSGAKISENIDTNTTLIDNIERAMRMLKS